VYPGVDGPVTTVAVMNWMVGMDSLDDDVVETLLTVFDKDRVGLEQVHEMAKQIDLGLLASPPIPLHSTAERWMEAREGR
jgi:TRAP-type uncharacterized transport system substrate-binding protein